MSDITEGLREEAARKSRSSLNEGCCDCGISANRLDGAADEIERLMANVEYFRGTLLALLSNIEALIEESDGVYGLHMNGGDAPWAELTDDGRFGDWMPLEGFREALRSR